MSEQELSTELLTWIREESEHAATNNSHVAVSIKLLILRLAIQNREAQDGDLTQSTEISLRSFERASLFRTLMHLNKRGFLHFLNSSGKNLQPDEVNGMYAKFMSGSVLGEVCLSKLGEQEVDRVRAFEKLSERQQSARRFDPRR